MKLSLGILLMVVAVFIVSLGNLFIQSRHIVRQEAQERASSVLNTTMQRFYQHMSTVETATNVNDWLICEHLHPDSLLALSRRVVLFNSHVDGCSISTEPEVFPQYGRYFSAYTVREQDTINTVVEEQYEYFEKIWYKTPRILRKPCWVVYYDEADSLSLTLDGMIASYSKPIYNDDDRFVAVISTDLSLRRLSEIINAEQPYPHSYYMMTGQDGHFIVHPDTTKLFVKTIFDDADPHRNADLISLGHQMISGEQGSMRVRIDGAPCLVCFQPVKGTSWSLAIVCPDNDILKGYHRLVYILIPLIIIGLLVILAFCRKGVAHAIRPLNLLAEQSKLIAAGNYDEHPIQHTQRLDAIGKLQNSFATMQESLSRHVSDISHVASETAERNEELAQAILLAEESDRQKSVFIQNMTHQIRTPLNIIMGFAQVLRDTKAHLPEEEVRTIADMMRHNGHLLSRMVSMLFDSSDSGRSVELNNQKQELVSCNAIARESIAYTHLHFPHLNVNFETTLPDTFCIQTSHIYLMRSLCELLYNSAKYSDGQHVTLRIEEGENVVRFVFQDTGPGIPKANHEQMFKPFTKANDLSEGLGLGLPLAKRHIDTMGGVFMLDTTYSDGCRFIIELPKK
jgi:signal transduction histidine kinase